MGANPTRRFLLQPEAIGAVMEVTKWLKPLVVDLHSKLVCHEALIMLAVGSTAQEAVPRRTCYRVLSEYRQRYTLSVDRELAGRKP